MSEMTLEQVRDELRNRTGLWGYTGVPEQCDRLADAIDAHLTRAPEQVTEKDELKKVIAAWDSLRGGVHHPAFIVERWLRDSMALAISEARKSLSAQAASTDIPNGLDELHLKLIEVTEERDSLRKTLSARLAQPVVAKVPDEWRETMQGLVDYMHEAGMPCERAERLLATPTFHGSTDICANCDALMPEGCKGTFKDEQECRLHDAAPTFARKEKAE
jgi:hypothetical protein